MNPQTLPAFLGSTAARVGLATGCGTASSLTTLAITHRAVTPAIAAGAMTAALAVNGAGSAFRALPRTIEAISNLLAVLIRARADAKATIIHAKVRAELARAGLQPGKTQQAVEMQRLLSVNPDLPHDRRPSDETLIKLHGASRARGSNEHGTSPDTPDSSSRSPKTGSRVVPIRPDT